MQQTPAYFDRPLPAGALGQHNLPPGAQLPHHLSQPVVPSTNPFDLPPRPGPSRPLPPINNANIPSGLPPAYEYDNSYNNNPWVYSPAAAAELGLNVPTFERQGGRGIPEEGMLRPHSRSASTSALVAPTMAFPEPQIPLSRASSATATIHGPRRGSQSHPPKNPEFGLSPSLMNLQNMPSMVSLQSTTSSYYRNSENYQDGLSSPTETIFSLETPSLETDGIARELSALSSDMEENIRRFQNGELKDEDQEWHRLVPEGALEALGNSEIKRQGIIFELFKAEREYVSDLELMEDVFIRGVSEANPPIIPDSIVASFINDVFGNLHDILVHHKRMLDALFERQRDTHPLIPSVADIVLETALKPEFRNAYEKYIKHYPVAESIHQKQRQVNKAYDAYLESISSNPRIKKRDLKIFLARPITRLPRLNLLLESMLHRTDKDYEHPDLETLPIILAILGECIKATQPGIEAAENRVKFWDLCENLQSRAGEILDLDLLDKERHMVYTGPVWGRLRPENSFSSEKWTEMNGALLDNYFLMYQEKRVGNTIKKIMLYQPLPLSFIRLAAFDKEPEIRREKVEDRGLLDSFRTRDVPMYPFTIYHTSPTNMKAYTLYTTTENVRKKWYSSFIDAIGVHKVKQEGNQWFSQEQLSDRFFRIPRETAMSPHSRSTGRITSAVPFAVGIGRFIAVGCASGIYVGPYGKEDYRKIFNFPNPTYIAALQAHGDKVFNKFIIHFGGSVVSYSLDLVARAAIGQGNPTILEASREAVTPGDSNVVFIRHIVTQDRVLLIYASKKRMGTSLNIHAIEAIAHSLQRATVSPTSSFRSFGQTGYIPKDAYDVISLVRTVGICTRDGLVTADPADFSSMSGSPVPVFHDASSHPPLAFLKSKIEGCKPLGFIRVTQDQILVIYDELGCYINTRGIPVRNCGFIRWETKAASYAYRGEHVLLVSPRYVEVRDIASGKLVQVIEGGDIRLMFADPISYPHDNILVVMRGRFNDASGLSEKIVELAKTVEISSNGNSPMWSEWDM